MRVKIDKAMGILGTDSHRLHPFCVSAYYAGESPEVVEARKTWLVPGARSAIEGHEDCYFFKTIEIPYDKRQQLLMVDIFEVEPTPKMNIPDDLIGRATMPLADPRLEQPAEWPLARGPWEFVGTVTVSVEFPAPEDKVWPLPDLSDFPPPVSPRDFARSKADKGGIDMSPFEQPRTISTKSSGGGGIDMSPFDQPRTRSNSKSSGGSSPSPVWVPVLNGPDGGFGLNPKVDNIWTFDSGCGGPVKGGTMSPLPSFPPQWFTAKLPPGTPQPLPLPPSAFQPPPVPPGLMAQIPVLATVPPAVAAMVVEALRAPPLTTASMPDGPDSRARDGAPRCGCDGGGSSARTTPDHGQHAPPASSSAASRALALLAANISGCAVLWRRSESVGICCPNGVQCSSGTWQKHVPCGLLSKASPLAAYFLCYLNSTSAVKFPMAPAQSGLSRATRVNGHLPTLLGNPGVKFPGTLRASEKKYLEVRVEKANEILGMDNFRLHPFCVSAYYPGEAQEVIEARKTSFVPGKKTALGSRREDCFFFETIRIPFNPRQQLLHVDIFEVQVPLQMQFEDEWVGRATLQLADPRVEQLAEYELARGPFEYGGTVTVSVKFPDPEVETHLLPDVRDFPKPVSPREYANSKKRGQLHTGLLAKFDHTMRQVVGPVGPLGRWAFLGLGSEDDFMILLIL
eukprot:s196_g15.t1